MNLLRLSVSKTTLKIEKTELTVEKCVKVVDSTVLENGLTQIADAIPVRIVKAAGINLIDDCLFPPLFSFHEQNLLFLMRSG